MLRGSEAEVLGGNGYVYVGMVVPVATACPGLLLVLEAEDDDGGSLNPIPFVTLAYQTKPLRVVDDEESPWLVVDGRGCQSHALLDVVQFVLWYRLVLVLSAAVSRRA